MTVARQHHGHQQRADRGRGAQDAEAERAGFKNVARIDRQQRRDAAEQHGEHIERDGAEDRRVAADEADAGEHIVGGRILFRGLLLRDVDEAGKNRAHQPEHDDDEIRQARREDVSQTAERGAGDGRDLGCAGGDRGRALHRALGRDQRQQRRRRRALEGAGDPDHEGGDEYLRHGEPAGKGADGQKQRGRRFRELAKLHHALALEPVGGVAGHENQQRRGQELHQPDHAELEGAAGDVVDLPADRNRCDLAGEARKAARQQEKQERPVPEQIAGAHRHRRGHERRVAERDADVNGQARNTALRGRPPLA